MELKGLTPPERLELTKGKDDAMKWPQWKRALEIYLDATEVTDPVKKRTLLLHCGGLQLQDVVYNLPGALLDPKAEENEGKDVFKEAITKLDSYFSPKQGRIYERHLFRQLKQEEDEKFDQFL